MKKRAEYKKNKRIYKTRVCPECGKRHFRGENRCISCMNARRKAREKKPLKIKDPQWERQRLQNLEMHRKRIWAEMKGMSPEEDKPLYEINSG